MSRLMEGKAGLVTGAAAGIGRACALRFAAEGAAVVVADLPGAVQGGEETVEQIRQAGGEAEFFPCDVSSAAANEGLVAHVVRRYGRLDFAHNNAGIGVHRRFHETSDEEFDRVIAVNLRGTFLGMKHQIAQMLRQDTPHRGAIVNTSSNAGLMAVVGLSAYTASKHGIIGLTKNAAVEYANDGIRVNAVCPGAIMTALMTNLPPDRAAEILRPAGPEAPRRPGRGRRRGRLALLRRCLVRHRRGAARRRRIGRLGLGPPRLTADPRAECGPRD